MNAIQAAQEPYKNAEPIVVDGPERWLLAHLTFAEKHYVKGRFHPALDIIADPRAKNRA